MRKVGFLVEVAFEGSVLAHIERSLSGSISTASRGATAGVRGKMPGFWPQHWAAIPGGFCDPHQG